MVFGAIVLLLKTGPPMLRPVLSFEKSSRSLNEPLAVKPVIVSWPLAVLRESLAAAKTNESATL
jgi:hypothetical protein